MSLTCPACDAPAIGLDKVLESLTPRDGINFPLDDLCALLEMVEDKSVLVTLACDFAERASTLVSNPVETKKWLKAAREWDENPEAIEQVIQAIRKKGVTIVSSRWANGAVEEACAVAADAAEIDTSWDGPAISTINEMVGGISFAVLAEAATYPNYLEKRVAEYTWQLEHARKLACNCPPPFAVAPLGARSRNSLLAG